MKKNDKPLKDWRKEILSELIGYNERGIVQYSSGNSVTHFKDPSAVCLNCGEGVKGKKAMDWMFGHKGCKKPNGKHVRTDLTPEKIEEVFDSAISQARQKGLVEGFKDALWTMRCKECKPDKQTNTKEENRKV